MRRQLIFAGPTLDDRCFSLELPSTTDDLHKNYLRRRMIFDGAADEVFLSYVHLYTPYAHKSGLEGSIEIRGASKFPTSKPLLRVFIRSIFVGAKQSFERSIQSNPRLCN